MSYYEYRISSNVLSYFSIFLRFDSFVNTVNIKMLARLVGKDVRACVCVCVAFEHESCKCVRVVHLSMSRARACVYFE